jgi:excisionase family DNA binding protein
VTTSTPQPPNNLFRSTPAEDDTMKTLRRQIDGIFREHGTGRLVGPDDETVEIPASALRALKLIVQSMARGQALTLVPHGKELTTQEAAEVLHISRPHLIKLLDAGTISHYKVGTHRRVRIEDILEYRERRASTRRENLDELTRLSEQLPGGYQ